VISPWKTASTTRSTPWEVNNPRCDRPDDDNTVRRFRRWVHHLGAENRKLYGIRPVIWPLRFYGSLLASATNQLSPAAGPNPSNSVAVGMKTQNQAATKTIRQGNTEQSSSHWPPSSRASIKEHPAPQPSGSRSGDVQPSRNGDRR
jgi:hypothetical protein